MADWPSFASSSTRPKAKGFAFTADAALAAIVFVVVMASLSTHSVFEPTPSFSDLELVRNMDASLEILDQAGTLQDLNAVEILFFNSPDREFAQISNAASPSCSGSGIQIPAGCKIPPGSRQQIISPSALQAGWRPIIPSPVAHMPFASMSCPGMMSGSSAWDYRGRFSPQHFPVESPLAPQRYSPTTSAISPGVWMAPPISAMSATSALPCAVRSTS